MVIFALTLLLFSAGFQALRRILDPASLRKPAPVLVLQPGMSPEREALERLRYHMLGILQDEEDVEEPEPVAATPVPAVFFKEGEPQTLEEFTSQPHITRKLQVQLAAAAERGERVAPPQIMLGFAGIGKTLLARIIAHTLQRHALANGWPVGEFIEVFPSDIDSADAIDAVMRRAQAKPGSTIFIDEVHALEGTHALKLYEVLTNNRYKFKDEPNPVELPPTQLLAATTDYGALHEALKRRWVKHFFRPVSAEELQQILHRRAFPIAPEAAQLIVSRTRWSGAPWESLELYNLACAVAQADHRACVDVCDVEEVFELEAVDAQGLRWLDRQVIEALLRQPKVLKDGTFVCYGASESNVCTIARVDRDEYRQVIRPRLMSRGFLEVRPYYGQALTPQCVAIYGS